MIEFSTGISSGNGFYKSSADSSITTYNRMVDRFNCGKKVWVRLEWFTNSKGEYNGTIGRFEPFGDPKELNFYVWVSKTRKVKVNMIGSLVTWLYGYEGSYDLKYKSYMGPKTVFTKQKLLEFKKLSDHILHDFVPKYRVEQKRVVGYKVGKQTTLFRRYYFQNPQESDQLVQSYSHIVCGGHMGAASNVAHLVEFVKEYYMKMDWRVLPTTGDSLLIMESKDPKLANFLLVIYPFVTNDCGFEFGHFIFKDEDEKWEALRNPFRNDYNRRMMNTLGAIDSTIK